MCADGHAVNAAHSELDFRWRKGDQEFSEGPLVPFGMARCSTPGFSYSELMIEILSHGVLLDW